MRALVVFVPVFWAWAGTTLHADLHEVSAARDRASVFAVALCGLFMALAVPQAHGTRGLLFGLGYWAARLLLALVPRSHHGAWFDPFTSGALVSGPLLVVGAVSCPARIGLWAAAALAVPCLRTPG